MRARLATAVLVVSLAASGCTGEEDPDVAPTLPPITESPTPSPEAVPTEASEATPEGAAEFVRFFYESLERAYATNDPSLIEALVTDDCSSCQNFVESLTELRDSGGSVDPYSVDVVDVQASAVDPASPTTSAVVIISTTEYVRRDADGTESAREAALDKVVNDLRLVRDGDSWLVQEITQ